MAAGEGAGPIEEYIHSHSDAGPCDTGEWRRIVASAYGHTCHDVVAEKDGHIHGLLRLYSMKSPLFGHVVATAPYASVGGLFADGPDTVDALVREGIDLCKRLNARWLEIKSSRRLDQPRLTGHQDFVRYWLPLSDEEELWNERFNNRARREVRRASESDLRLERGHHLFDTFYRVMSVGMRRLGTPVHSGDFYHSILTEFGPKADLVAVYSGDMAIAALISVWWRDGFYPLYQASLPEGWHLKPNNFLYWEAMKHACREGATSFDFGRSLKDSGPARFKKTWNCESEPLSYEYFLNRGRSIPRIHQENPRLQLARAAWQRLPLFATKWLGPVLIKGVP
jgi:FemAB-related protein (PEP-CTERM system-associated)